MSAEKDYERAGLPGLESQLVRRGTAIHTALGAAAYWKEEHDALAQRVTEACNAVEKRCAGELAAVVAVHKRSTRIVGVAGILAVSLAVAAGYCLGAASNERANHGALRAVP